MPPMVNLPQIALGAILALVVVMAAVAAKALTISGGATAFLLGTLVFGLGGIPWAVILLAFFVTSSVLSLLFKRRKQGGSAEYEKGSRRDGWQVLANGGIAGLMVVLHVFYPASILPWLAAAASLAAANADTWATELGFLSARNPRLITSGRAVPVGSSGAVSGLGVLAAFLGSTVIAAVFLGFSAGQGGHLAVIPRLQLAGAVAISGLAGSLVDSLLGATLQAIYFCPACQKETETHPLHHCGTPTALMRGWRWLNNDWVNLFCTLSGALAAILIGNLILP